MPAAGGDGSRRGSPLRRVTGPSVNDSAISLQARSFFTAHAASACAPAACQLHPALPPTPAPAPLACICRPCAAGSPSPRLRQHCAPRHERGQQLHADGRSLAGARGARKRLVGGLLDGECGTQASVRDPATGVWGRSSPLCRRHRHAPPNITTSAYGYCMQHHLTAFASGAVADNLSLIHWWGLSCRPRIIAPRGRARLREPRHIKPPHLSVGVCHLFRVLVKPDLISVASFFSTHCRALLPLHPKDQGFAVPAA
jgi:hypothetical protein